MNTKRPLLNGSASVAKKPTPTRQTSLLSMFKPKVSPAKQVEDATTSTTSIITTTSTSVTTLPRATDLLPNLSEEHKMLLDLEMTTMHPEWIKALKPEFTKAYFIQLKRFLEAENAANKKIFPPSSEIYSWSNYTPPSNVKVVIIGQDPYHNDGQAHGLCFSVKKGVPPPPSLGNIYEALRRDYPDFKKPKHGFLENWAKQGVLLLNTSLTVRAHEPSSHSKKGWEQLTDSIISYLSEKKAHIVFILWGAHAQARAGRIDKSKHLVLKAVHPSPLSAHRGFFDCNHFKQVNEYLRNNARVPINWDCLDD